MHNSDEILIMNCAFGSLFFFFALGTDNYFSNIDHFKMFIHRLRTQAFFVFPVALFELQTPANDGNISEDFDSRAELSVRVRKGGFMGETLRHYNSGPNVTL